MSVRIRIPLVAAAIALCVGAISSSTVAEGLIVLPESIDLGVVPPEAVRRDSLWIVNDSGSPERIVGVQASCGCVTPDAEVLAGLPRTLEPGQAMELPFAVAAERLPMGMSPELRIIGSRGALPGVPVRIVSDSGAPVDAWAASPSPPHLLRAVPAVVDFGSVEIGAEASAEVWIVNTAEHAVDVASIAPACGCTSVHGFEPGRLEAGAARRVTLAMTAPGSPRTKESRVSIRSGTRAPVVVPVRMEAVHPLVARVEALRHARDSGDAATMRMLLSEDSRVWYDTREGPGVRRDENGSGTWASWDRTMHATVEAGAFVVDGREVSVEIVEANDYDRLLERDPGRVRLTYTFDADDRLAATLVEGIGDRTDRGRIDAFLAWAQDAAPEELEAIYPGGRLDPSGDHAGRCRALLRAWRMDEG